MPRAYHEGGSRTPASILASTCAHDRGIRAAGQPMIPTVNGTAFVALLKENGISGLGMGAFP